MKILVKYSPKLVYMCKIDPITGNNLFSKIGPILPNIQLFAANETGFGLWKWAINSGLRSPASPRKFVRQLIDRISGQSIDWPNSPGQSHARTQSLTAAKPPKIGVSESK